MTSTPRSEQGDSLNGKTCLIYYQLNENRWKCHKFATLLVANSVRSREQLEFIWTASRVIALRLLRRAEWRLLPLAVLLLGSCTRVPVCIRSSVVGYTDPAGFRSLKRETRFRWTPCQRQYSYTTTGCTATTDVFSEVGPIPNPAGQPNPTFNSPDKIIVWD